MYGRDKPEGIKALLHILSPAFKTERENILKFKQLSFFKGTSFLKKKKEKGFKKHMENSHKPKKKKKKKDDLPSWPYKL